MGRNPLGRLPKPDQEARLHRRPLPSSALSKTAHSPLAISTVPKQTTGGPYVPKHGNSLVIQLVLNAMKLQPCRPSFFEARDAIIQADQVLTGGENFCTLWEGFSSRGLGEDAKVINRTPWGGGLRTNGYKKPYGCEDVEVPEPGPQEPEEPDYPDELENWLVRIYGGRF
jgi:extracellular elastinolytic metalloproteinase